MLRYIYKRKYYNNHESSDFICLSFYIRRGGIEVQMSTRSSQKIYLTQCCFRRSIQRWEIFCCLNCLHWSLLWGCNLSYKTCPSGLTSDLSIWGLVGASSVKKTCFYQNNIVPSSFSEKKKIVKGLSIPDPRSKSQARLTSGLGLISLIYADGEVLQLQS